MSDFKDLYPKEELPYDKFLHTGAESLTDAELLAIMLRTGTKDKNPVELGRQILSLCDSKWGLLGLHHYSVRELQKIPGIGEVKAVQLLCIAEIAKRISVAQAASNLAFHRPDTVAEYYMERLRNKNTEQVILILLDSKNRLIHDKVLSLGTVNASLISPREILIYALREEAGGIMLLHNHPSGDPTPSKQDIIIVAGKYLYRRMGLALENCGRDILFSACSWGADETHEWMKESSAGMWRSTGDIFDTWESVKDLVHQQEKLLPYNATGCFNDMDMLIVGMYGQGNVGLKGCNDTQYKTHYSIWALLGSPLMIGCDIRNMNDATRNILMNRDLIAINQDAMLLL